MSSFTMVKRNPVFQYEVSKLYFIADFFHFREMMFWEHPLSKAGASEGDPLFAVPNLRLLTMGGAAGALRSVHL